MASSKYATFKKTTDTYGTDYYLAFFVPKDVHFGLLSTSPYNEHAVYS